MIDPARALSRRSRTVKALAVATASTSIALASHLLAGGPVPGPIGILVPFVFSALVCLPLSGLLLSLPRLVASVSVSQFLFHTLFVLGTGGSSGGATAGIHAHHGGGTALLGVGPETTATTGHDATMWLGHAVAAALTILLIRRGETALVGLWRLAGRLARAVAPRPARIVPIPFPAPPGAQVETRTPRPVGRVVVSALSRRGPPLLPAIS